MKKLDLCLSAIYAKNCSFSCILKIIFIILSFTVFQGIYGQSLRSTYPVQVSAFMKPPYSLYLDDYSRLDAEKLILTLINRDLLQPEVEVRLHLRINAGNQVILESNDHKPLPAFHLVPGEPLQVSQSDLAAYFMKENLQASGAFSGRFPEGMLEICITVLEANTGRQLSQRTCARAWISLNRPPLLSLPLNQTKFPMREPQQFVFQWTPRHQGLSQVEYRLVLKEIPATQGAPENAFASAQEVFSTTVYGTSFAYNTAIHPPLLENMTYAWQVQAVARDGFNELNIFENQGYSEVRTFSMAASCYPPTGINQHQEGAFAVVGWTPPQPGTQSVVSYRRSDATGQWHDRSVNQDHVNLTDLAFGVEYVCKVGTRCSDGTVTYGEEITFTLEDWRKKVEASCGVLPDPDLDRTTRLEELNPGDVFIAGDFPVYVTRIKNGAMGIFSGIGWTSLPMFMDAKVVVHFDNITLNAQKQLISGAVETSYDASEAGLADLDELTHGKTGTGQTVTGDIWSGVKANFEIPPGSTFKYDPKTNMLVVTDANGQPVGEILIPEKDRDKFTNTEPFTYVIQDSKENVYTISGDGKGENGEVTVENTGTKNDDIKFNPEQISTKDVVIRFKQAPGASYAFDEWQKYYESVSLINNKKIYEHLGAYDVPCKLIPPGKADKVSYELEIIKKGGIDTSKIVFKTGSGYVLKHDASRQEIQLTGGNPNDAQDIYALYPDQSGAYQTVGKLKVLSYPEKSFKVKLIPVYDQKEKRIFTTDPGSIQKTLDNAFNPLGITWDVELDKPFEYPSADITSDGSGLLSRYSDEMKALNAAYKAERGTDKNTVYLFILNKGDVKGLNPAGEMPRGKQFGYLFTGNRGNIPQTVAHELGHGRFQLQHTFDGEYGSEAAATKNKTDNLMDYDGKLHLAKWQWDEIFAQAILVNPFEGDEDAMGPVASNDKLYACLEEIRQSQIKGTDVNVRSYLLTSGNKITLGGRQYQFISIKRMSTSKTTLSLKGCQPEVFSEWNLYQEEQYCIGYLNRTITIVAATKEDRDNLLKYLSATRSNSFLLFVSGYEWSNEIQEFFNRNKDKEGKETWWDNFIGLMDKTPANSDEKQYWGEPFIDAMVSRLMPKKTTFMSGHDDIGTSNHKTIFNFVDELYNAFNVRYNIANPLYYHNPLCKVLMTTPNTSGFNQRRNSGKQWGMGYVNELKTECSRDANGLVTDTLDVVCHSMGFAHALGVIDAIKDAMKTDLKGLKLGRFYIFAPENACSGSVTLSDWTQVWQYGSDESTLKTQTWLQDGVAPQTGVPGLSRNQRAFIPIDGSVPQGFLESHSIKNYMWIFNTLTLKDPGYVTPRK